MSRATRLFLPSLVVSAVLLGGCGSTDASFDNVRDRVETALIARDVDSAEAAGMATCVANDMFDVNGWSKDERNAATRALDSTPIDPDLVTKLRDLLDECGALAILRGESTATEPDAADTDDTTTSTTEG